MSNDPYRTNAKIIKPIVKAKSGDVVCLKSGGGPIMTIGYVDNCGRALCYFFGGEGFSAKLDKLEIYIDALIPVEVG